MRIPEIYNLPLEEIEKPERIIGHIKGEQKGPTVVFFAGIHGNEPAGVLALERIFQELGPQQKHINGEIYGIAGNLNALVKKMRFQEEDLNRIWFPDRIELIQSKNGECSFEEVELLHLHGFLLRVLKNGTSPFYFIDLHTTSSATEPFVVLNDSLLNRKFASNYPLPIILGIEEYLEGALLSYINDMGYVSLGYESGQHNDPEAIENCTGFIYKTLCLTESLGFDDFEKFFLDSKNSDHRSRSIFYEIYFQYHIDSGCDFKMLPGFENFQVIPKKMKIAYCNNTAIETNRERQIFMPLYQDQGSEGFYFIRPIPRILLWLSKGLRRFKVDHLLVRLPGIAWKSQKKGTMIVDQRVARFMAKSFFHLLGYRARQYNSTHLIVKSREASSRTKDYINTSWFKGKKKGPN